MEKITSVWQRFYPLVLIAIAGLALRFYGLTAISLWHDEAFSALLIKYSWSEMLYRIGLDVHPPLYYIILRFWHYIFGDSLLSLRGFSMACGILTIILVYYLVLKFFASRKAAVFSSLLFAFNFFQIDNVGGEARMYTLGVLLNVAAAGSLIQALRLQSAQEVHTKRVWLWYGIFAVLGAALLYTHYYLAFSLVALGLYALFYHLKNFANQKDFAAAGKRFLPFLAACAGVGVLFFPWLKTFLFQLSQVQGGYWIPPIDRWSIPSTFWDISLGLRTSMIPSHWLELIITIASLGMIIGLIRMVRQPEKWLLIFNIFAPFVGAVGFYLINHLQGHDSSVFLVRYFAFAGVFYSIALGVWMAHWQHKTFAWICMVIILGINMFGFIHFWDDLDAPNKPGMAAASEYLATYVAADDKIIVGTSFEFFNFKYYNRTPVTPKLFTGGSTRVEDLPHFAGTAILTEADLAPDFNTAAKPEDTVWLIWTNAFGSNKPMVPAKWVQVSEHKYDDARPYVGTVIYVDQYKVN